MSRARRHVYRLATGLLASTLLCALPGEAFAFSDLTVFADPVLEGGSDGRYFTGSPIDPYSCSVCHRGGRTPEIDITGMPERLVPGETHDVTIRWSQPETSRSLHVELMEPSGAHADVALRDADDPPPRERCEQAEDGEPAVFSLDVGDRRVIGVQDCGASQLRFRFSVPDVPKLYFALGMVQSDGSGTPEGDGVLELRRVITQRSQEPDAGACSVVAPRATRAGGASSPWGLLLAGCAFAWRRRAGCRARDRHTRQPRLLSLLGFALCIAGCYEPSSSADEPVADAALPYIDEFSRILDESQTGSHGDASVACAREPSGSKGLRFSVRTASAGGRYRPRNVGAIWIEDASGKWVKTLERWGERRAKWLRAWSEASAGDLIDAVTSATLPMHQVHELTWDLTDGSGCEVSSGSYKVRLELTDWSGQGPNTEVPFALEGSKAVVNPEDQPSFRQMQLELE